jgi:hypothetical protein
MRLSQRDQLTSFQYSLNAVALLTGFVYSACADEPSAHFEPLDLVGTDPDAWDDSALVDAFDTALSSYRTGHALGATQARRPKAAKPMKPAQPVRAKPSAHRVQPAQPERRVELQPDPVAQNPGADYPQDPVPRAHRLMIPAPPPPPGIGDVELEKLLLAWYEAGFRAGRYSVLRENHG